MSKKDIRQDWTGLWLMLVADELHDHGADYSYYPQGVQRAIATLGEREQAALEYRYRDGMTLDEAGRRLGVGKERVRQIQARALARLRHPSRMDMMRCVPLDEYKKAVEELALFRQRAWFLLRDCTKQCGGEDCAVGVDDTSSLMDTKIEHMNLTVRTYNCLRRAEILTLGALLDYSATDLMNIRNFGCRSIQEIKEVLNRHGLELKQGIRRGRMLPSMGRDSKDA
jgi:hypothetical protein